MRIGQREQAAREAAQPGLVDCRQRERQCESQRLRAAGGQVAEVDRQRLVAEARRVDRREKVPPFDQHVGGHRELHARGRCQQRAVVAHAQR